jgi:hypothetical protein
MAIGWDWSKKEEKEVEEKKADKKKDSLLDDWGSL